MHERLPALLGVLIAFSAACSGAPAAEESYDETGENTTTPPGGDDAETESEDTGAGTGETPTHDAGETKTDSGSTGATDTGTSDPGTRDSGTHDSGTRDTGTRDTGTTDTGAVTDSSTPPVDTGTTEPPVTGMRLASNISITEVAFFQGVKVSVSKNGVRVATRPAPVIAGREALVRVYVTPKTGWSAHELVGELRLVSASGALTYSARLTPAAASTDASLTSSLNFNVPAGVLNADTKYSVSLFDPSATTNGDARIPAAGEELLEAKDTGASLKVVLVPVKYDADGSGRLPDTTAAQIELYRKELYAMYPAKKVEITVREPWSYAGSVTPDGSGFSPLLQSIVKLRQTDGAARDVYYYGAFAGRTSFSAWCSGGCVTGICGLLTSPTDSAGRACIGIGYTGATSAGTAAHEIGHAHGRSHAPCGGVSGADSRFPYAGGTIGSWGYDLVSKKLIDPKVGKDFMSYCSPEWISDYSFNAIATRMAAVAGSAFMFNAPDPGNSWGGPSGGTHDVNYRFVDVGGDGTLTWGDTVALKEPPIADPQTITWEADDGTVLGSATGQYYPYDDLPGGYMLVPVDHTPISATIANVHLRSPQITRRLTIPR